MQCYDELDCLNLAELAHNLKYVLSHTISILIRELEYDAYSV
jgi:hypothetical protein